MRIVVDSLAVQGSTVGLVRNGEVLVVEMESLEDAAALNARIKQRMGIHQIDRDLRIDYMSVLLLQAGGIYLSQFSEPSLFGYLSAAVALGIVALGLYGLFAPYRLIIGTDGVVVNHWGRRRVIRMNEISEATASDQGLKIRVEDGKVHTFPALGQTAAILASDIRDKLERLLSQSNVGAKLPERDRGESLDQWSARIDRAATGEYRDSALSVDDLKGVLSNSELGLNQRLAAAAVLTYQHSRGSDVREVVSSSIDQGFADELEELLEEDERIRQVARL